jgi:hypothetical protein
MHSELKHFRIHKKLSNAKKYDMLPNLTMIMVLYLFSKAQVFSSQKNMLFKDVLCCIAFMKLTLLTIFELNGNNSSVLCLLFLLRQIQLAV